MPPLPTSDAGDTSAPAGDDWVALRHDALPVAAAGDWVVLPSCGATVTFTGTSRDHSGEPGSPSERRGVTVLDYEAYAEQVEPRLAAVVAEVRRRWPDVGRIALWHRVGAVAVGEASVLVAVSTPHRDAAFAAARFAIDAVKATVPIWKREVWPGGSEWGVDAHPVEDLRTFAGGTT